MESFNPSEPIAPSDADAALARDSAPRLATSLKGANAVVKVTIGEEGETISVPTSAFRLLVSILGEMASGNAVRLMPHHAELTTQEAADLFNVSRPYFTRLLNEGRLPYHRVGTHRRVYLKDVLAYKTEHHRARRKTLDALSALDQELGL
jgi:excisionase family DNA binding protein